LGAGDIGSDKISLDDVMGAIEVNKDAAWIVARNNVAGARTGAADEIGGREDVHSVGIRERMRAAGIHTDEIALDGKSVGALDIDTRGDVARNNVTGGETGAADAITRIRIKFDAKIIRPGNCPGGIGPNKTALNHACRCVHEDTVAAILARRAIDYQTSNGAAKRSNIQCVKNGGTWSIDLNENYRVVTVGQSIGAGPWLDVTIDQNLVGYVR